MNKVTFYLVLVMVLSITGCSKSSNGSKAAVESKYDVVLPKAIIIHEASEHFRSFQADLTRKDWEDWNIEPYGYPEWKRFSDWQFFDMREFAVEQKPGQEKYFSVRTEGSKKFYLFYDADSQLILGAIE